MRCNEVDNVSEVIQLRDLLQAEVAQMQSQPARGMIAGGDFPQSRHIDRFFEAL